MQEKPFFGRKSYLVIAVVPILCILLTYCLVLITLACQNDTVYESTSERLWTTPFALTVENKALS